MQLHPGPVPLSAVPDENVYHFLSRRFVGDVISPVWGRGGAESLKGLDAARRACGRFGYHVTFSQYMPSMYRALWEWLFLLGKGLALSVKHGRYDVIVAYGPTRPAVAGLLLKWLTRTPLVVELPGSLSKSLLMEEERPTRLQRVKAAAGRAIARRILVAADHVKLLYPGQLDGVVDPGKVKASVFANFVPVSRISPADEPGGYILSMGYPWRVKGMDVVIEAFHRIKDEFTGVSLKIVGYCPDMRPYAALAKADPRIELCPAVHRGQAIELIRRCRVYVLASRTEAMGRVLLEAMAARKPIIASAVDGVPHYVRDGVNGLLFPPEDVGALADRMRRVLSDPVLAEGVASRARDRVTAEYSEERYVSNFESMIGNLLKDRRPGSRPN